MRGSVTAMRGSVTAALSRGAVSVDEGLLGWRLAPLPAQIADVRTCGSASELFAQLRESPELAYLCAPLLPTEAQRDQVLREAFLAKPLVARNYLPVILDRPWLPGTGFFPLLELAQAVPPEQARKLLLMAARHYPALALREPAFSGDLFEIAALGAPDDAVGLAGGSSVSSERLRSWMQASANPDVRVLLALANDRSAGSAERQRAAVFFRQIARGSMTIPAALAIAGGPGFFPAAAQLRISASADEAPLYDRVLEVYAEVLMRSGAELRQLSARDLYLVLSYGRTEEDDKIFASIFDRLLVPKLRNGKLAALLDEVRGLHLRRFLTTALAHRRMDAFIALAGNKTEQAALLARSVSGIENLEDTLTAAEILDSVQGMERLEGLQAVLCSEYEHHPQTRTLYGLLASRLAQRLGSQADRAFLQIAAKYQPYFKQPRVLDAASLFRAGLCIQQHFFYDDDDAAESFASFSKIYSHDPAWNWEDHGWYVHLTGTGKAGRSIEIYANTPQANTAASLDDRRHALTRLLAQRRLTPTVVVHRGHTWYVDQSLRYLNPSARLVYLGSCRGLVSAASVMALAKGAQIIATRGVGTLTVNDPLLKGINSELLRGAPTLDWDAFWLAQQGKFRGNGEFRDYVPPPRNAPAILLAAYYEFLAEAR